MANPFDRFDATGSKPSANPFDRFDASQESKEQPKNELPDIDIQSGVEPVGKSNVGQLHFGSMLNTLRNIGKVYPAFETAANFATSMYGVPISGLVALAALPFGPENANNALKSAQKFLIYNPQTEAGQQLTEAASYPMAQYAQAGNAVGEKVAGVAGAEAGAIAEGAMAAAPAALGYRKAFSESPAVPRGIAIEEGINKAIRPSVTKKEVWSQREKYMQNARTAVDEIIKNKDNLRLIDKDGNETVKQLPKSLQEFSQAIEQTKRQIYEQYNALAEQATGQGASISMTPIVAELDGIANNRVMRTMSPETIQYAKARQQALADQAFSPVEIQEMIQMLNQSEKAYYANPTPDMKGRAYVDSLIANNMRQALDAAIEQATGVEYQPLKNKYGALRMLETDVTKRAIVDARKNVKGLIDFSDIFSGAQAVQGVLSFNPATIASGAAAKTIASMIKSWNDPNKIVSKMFNRAEKFSFQTPSGEYTVTPNLIVSSKTAEEEIGD